MLRIFSSPCRWDKGMNKGKNIDSNKKLNRFLKMFFYQIQSFYLFFQLLFSLREHISSHELSFLSLTQFQGFVWWKTKIKNTKNLKSSEAKPSVIY